MTYRHNIANSVIKITSILSILFCILFISIGCVSKSTYITSEEERIALQKNNLMLNNRIVSMTKEKQQLDTQLKSKGEELISINQLLKLKLQEIAAKKFELSATTEQLDATNKELNIKSDALNMTRQDLQITKKAASKAQKLYNDLSKEFETEMANSQIKIRQIKDGIVMDLTEDILFSSGSAKVNPIGQNVIVKVSDKLKNAPYRIEVAGFTDNIPIKGKLANLFPTNWDLAGARAARVVTILEKAGVDVAKLAATSYGENSPIASNDTKEGRAQNRRIEIRLRPIK